MNIEIRGVVFSYRDRGRDREQLHDVTFNVPEGAVCCLLGPNGAGKTTLIRCIVGFLTPDQGSIRLTGRDRHTLTTRQLARLVAYVPQSTSTVFPFTALDVAVMGRTPHLAPTSMPSRKDHRKARDTLDQLGIGHLASRRFTQLSGGERQLVLLARALVQEAPILVLDEPTASLDYGNEIRILDVIRGLASSGRSILMTTHQPNHALWWADLAVLLSGGAVQATGAPREVVTSDALTTLYGVPIHLGPLRMSEGQDQLTCAPDLTRKKEA